MAGGRDSLGCAKLWRNYFRTGFSPAGDHCTKPCQAFVSQVVNSVANSPTRNPASSTLATSMCVRLPFRSRMDTSPERVNANVEYFRMSSIFLTEITVSTLRRYRDLVKEWQPCVNVFVFSAGNLVPDQLEPHCRKTSAPRFTFSGARHAFLIEPDKRCALIFIHKGE